MKTNFKEHLHFGDGMSTNLKDLNAATKDLNDQLRAWDLPALTAEAVRLGLERVTASERTIWRLISGAAVWKFHRVGSTPDPDWSNGGATFTDEAAAIRWLLISYEAQKTRALVDATEARSLVRATTSLKETWLNEATEREARAQNFDVVGMIERLTEEAAVRALRRCAAALDGVS
jgi:hypothetical protein